MKNPLSIESSKAFLPAPLAEKHPSWRSEKGGDSSLPSLIEACFIRIKEELQAGWNWLLNSFCCSTDRKVALLSEKRPLSQISSSSSSASEKKGAGKNGMEQKDPLPLSRGEYLLFGGALSSIVCSHLKEVPLFGKISFPIQILNQFFQLASLADGVKGNRERIALIGADLTIGNLPLLRVPFKAWKTYLIAKQAFEGIKAGWNRPSEQSSSRLWNTAVRLIYAPFLLFDCFNSIQSDRLFYLQLQKEKGLNGKGYFENYTTLLKSGNGPLEDEPPPPPVEEKPKGYPENTPMENFEELYFKLAKEIEKQETDFLLTRAPNR